YPWADFRVAFANKGVESARLADCKVAEFRSCFDRLRDKGIADFTMTRDNKRQGESCGKERGKKWTHLPRLFFVQAGVSGGVRASPYSLRFTRPRELRPMGRGQLGR